VARLHDYIAGLPSGYETLVGERGVSLSGGQRQRLSIARSILLSPPILVFDDSTAAVDAGTEQAIREALRAERANRATIIIAHRLGSLMDADEIIFLDEGRIVERGNHAELLRLGGRYASLYALQSAGGEPDPAA
jgi:ATP-binding cassette subfamily B protein